MLVVENLSRKLQEDGIVRNYYYRLVKNEIFLYFNGKDNEVQAYGIEIERQDVVNGRVVNIERNCIDSISPYRHKVHNLIKILYEGTVSPIHFLDIVGEDVDSCIEDFDYELKNILSC